MPCKDPNHEHVWPENHPEASLVISRCELLCAYCESSERKQFAKPQDLIRHVANKHTGRGGGIEGIYRDGTELTHHLVDLRRSLGRAPGKDYEKVYDGSDMEDGEDLTKQLSQVKLKTTKKKDTRKPDTRKPTTRKSTTRKPTTRKSTTREPTTRKPAIRKPTTRKPTTLNVMTRSQQATASAENSPNVPALGEASADHGNKSTRKVRFAMDISEPNSILKKRKAEEIESDTDEMKGGGGEVNGEEGGVEKDNCDVKEKQEQETTARLVAHGIVEGMELLQIKRRKI